MSGPVITVNLKKMEDNTRVIVDFCEEHGIDVIGVSKVTCGMPSVAKAMISGGVTGIGESRIENINRLRMSGINHPVTLLRIPPLSGVDEIVNSVDTSLNSELSVIKELSLAADKKGKVHGIILMLDLGDLREGIWPDDLLQIAAETAGLPGVRLAGLGTNLTCYGGVLPSEKNMQMLTDYAHRIEDSLNIKLDILSGGNSSSLDLVRRYVGYIESAYLVFSVNIFSYSLKEQEVNPRKIYSLMEMAFAGVIYDRTDLNIANSPPDFG